MTTQSASVNLPSTSLVLNRELSLLEFQRRVLDEAQDEKNPLLERIKFLAIFGSNMDEFFMLRISGIHKRMLLRNGEDSFTTLTPSNELTAIRKLASDLYTTALQ